MKTLSPTKCKTATVVIALAGLLGTTSVFAGRASGVSSAGKVEHVAAPATVTHASRPSHPDSSHAARITKVEAEMHDIRTTLNLLIEATPR